MFSSNDKISPRQIKRLLVFDLFGAGSLVLPTQLAKSGNGIGVWSILAGMVFAGAYLWVLYTCSSRTVSDYMGYLKTGWGSILARLLYLCYAVIGIFACAWAAKLLSALVCDSLLEDGELPVALLVVMLLAFYGASAGIEARARVYEILFWILVIPLVVMLLLCIRQVQVIQWFPLAGSGDAISWSWFWSGTWQCFGAFAPLTFLLFLVPHEQDKKKSGRAALCAGLLNGLALAVVYLILLGIFGSGALAREEYPVITLMGMVKIPGEFLKRLDTVMVGGWFFTLYALIGTTLYYGAVIARRALTGWETGVQGEKGKSGNRSAIDKEKSGNERSGNERSGNEKSGNEKSGNERSGNEKSGNERSVNEKSGNERSGKEKSSKEISGKERSVSESKADRQGRNWWFLVMAAAAYGIAYGFYVWPQAEHMAIRVFYLLGVPFLAVVPVVSLFLCKGEAD